MRSPSSDARALALYTQMEAEGSIPSIGILLAALKVCRSSRNLAMGRHLHSHAMATSTHCSNTVVSNLLIDMYSKCGAGGDALDVFAAIPPPSRDVVSWTSIIQALARAGDCRRALDLFAALLDDRFCSPDRLALLAAIKACIGLIDRERVDPATRRNLAKAMHSQVVRSGEETDGFVAGAMVEVYCRSGSLLDALQVLWNLEEINVVCWTSMILGAVSCGESKLAIELFDRMREEGCSPDSVAILAAIKACANLIGEDPEKILRRGRSLHALAVATPPFELDLPSANSLIGLYAKSGSLRDSIEVFELIPASKRSTVSWNCLILGTIESGNPKLAIKFFSDMENQSYCRPDRITFIAVLKACSSLGDLGAGRKMEARMISLIDNGGDVTLANALVDFYGKCASMDDAERVFWSISRKNLVTWSSIIAGHSRQGDAARVFELFELMQADPERIQPDGTTYLSVLSVCSRSGLAARGKIYFEEMRSKHGLVPGIEHYTCLVRLLGQANFLEEARKVVEEMPVKPDLVIWIALLECCKLWKNVEVGRFAFQGAVEIDDKNATAYVLMSSLYDDCG